MAKICTVKYKLILKETSLSNHSIYLFFFSDFFLGVRLWYSYCIFKMNSASTED